MPLDPSASNSTKHPQHGIFKSSEHHRRTHGTRGQRQTAKARHAAAPPRTEAATPGLPLPVYQPSSGEPRHPVDATNVRPDGIEAQPSAGDMRPV
jgi:hypothetical protein